MRDDLNIGIVSALQAKRAAVLARNPQVERAVLGKPLHRIATRVHRITVDCRTGEREVQSVEAAAVNPFGASRPPVVVRPPPPPTPRPTVFRPDGARRIIATVARHWECPDILSPRRADRFARPRFAAMRLIRDRLGLSTTMIGKLLGGRDHTTAISGLKRAAYLHEHDEDWRQRYDAVLAELTESEP